MILNGKYDLKIPLGMSKIMSYGKYDPKIPLVVSKIMSNGKYVPKIPLEILKIMSNGKKNLENYISDFQVLLHFVN